MAVAVLVVMAVDWQGPASALGLGVDGRTCRYPDPVERSGQAGARIELLGCPSPGRPVGAAVWAFARNGTGDVHLQLDPGLPGESSWSIFTGELGPDWTRVETTAIRFGSVGPYTMRVLADQPTGSSGPIEIGRLTVHIGRTCTAAYRGPGPVAPTCTTG